MALAQSELYQRRSYHYELPKELIAQYPCDPRDGSRLLLVDRATGTIELQPFCFLQELLKAGDSLVFNDTKVIPARLQGRRVSGAAVEIVVVRIHSEGIWEALVRPGRKIKKGEKLFIAQDFSCEMVEPLGLGSYLLQIHSPLSSERLLECYGSLALPHYIRGGVAQLSDKENYQTIFAANPGAIATPTAALHFTPSLLTALHTKGVSHSTITLHVGVGTFRPVTSEDIRNHLIHRERVFISEQTALHLNGRDTSCRQICVGTTCCRALENSCQQGVIAAGSYDASLFIYPGYCFRYVTSLLTNFHQPESTLLMLVAAFAGYELTMRAYQAAIDLRLRFFSYGDAMLIL